MFHSKIANWKVQWVKDEQNLYNLRGSTVELILIDFLVLKDTHFEFV